MDATLMVASIGAITTILGIWITHYLTKSHYEQKRRDELADREFIRRAAIYDQRIQEVRESLDGWNAMIVAMRVISLILIEPEQLKKHRTYVEQTYSHFLYLDQRFISNEIYDLLGDSELTALHSEFLLEMHPRVTAFVEVVNKLESKRKFEMDVAGLKLLSVPVEVANLVTKMESKLDKLSYTLK